MDVERSNGEVYPNRWSFIIIPENFCIDSLVAVHELFEDLWDIGLDDHVQYPTVVLFKESNGMSA